MRLAALVLAVVLLVTTITSPTKQGLHDRVAGSTVVEAARLSESDVAAKP
jgi:uncharacterized RDD family membrane protein YckC